MSGAYRQLEERFRRLTLIREAMAMLRWDMSVVMPHGSSAARGEQIAALKLLIHEMMSDPALVDLLDAAEADNDTLDDWQAANLRQMRRRWVHTTAVPADLVDALSRATNICESIWRTARPASDYDGVRPHLETVLRLSRDVAAAKADALDVPPYEALLDLYEPGATTARLDALFADYGAFLPDFLDRVLARQAVEPEPVEPAGPFSLPRQEALCRKFAEAVGIEFSTARLDPTLHPFSGGIPEDSRITTRYDEGDFGSALMAVLHESGHAMYERGRPADWRYQPVGETPGLGMHESQSLIVEMQACRSPAFLKWAAPHIRDAFGGEGPAWTPENLRRKATRVRRSFIRVDADEVTYPAHVILRYRLERAMIEGDLGLDDLPGAWKAGMLELLGIVPPDDRQGCLQDIHWYDGAWGYFPTYTIGAMAAAQLFAKIREDIDDLDGSLVAGDFSPLMRWLREHVHRMGARYTTDELLMRATGRPFDSSAFKAHLQQRYLGDQA